MKVQELMEGKVITAYHRTWKEENAKLILKEGFRTDLHRKEVYLTCSWESANGLDGKTGGDYGKFLIRCKVDTSGFPKTGKTERGGDGDLLIIADPSIITPLDYTILDIDDPTYWVDGKIGYKFIKDFPTPEQMKWKK